MHKKTLFSVSFETVCSLWVWCKDIILVGQALLVALLSLWLPHERNEQFFFFLNEKAWKAFLVFIIQLNSHCQSSLLENLSIGISSYYPDYADVSHSIKCYFTEKDQCGFSMLGLNPQVDTQDCFWASHHQKYVFTHVNSFQLCSFRPDTTVDCWRISFLDHIRVRKRFSPGHWVDL